MLRPRASRLKSPSPVPELNTPNEMRAFDFFKSRSSALLGGITLKGDEFWSGIVIRLAVTEPAVRHAVLALSSLHESVCEGDDWGVRKSGGNFAFQEYGKAITAMREYNMGGGREPAAIPLLVCVLFVCIEFLMKYEAAAQLHIMQGRMILSKMSGFTGQSPALDMVRKVLVPIYARLSLASYLFAVRPEPIPRHLTFGEGTQPLVLESIQEARDVLYHIVDEGLAFTTQAKPACYMPMEPWQLHMFEETQQKFLTQLTRWNAAFTLWKSDQVSQTTNSKATQDLLYLWYHAARVYVSMALSPSELAYDQYNSDFAAIISYASSAIAAPGSLQREDAAFTFETEILAPVYWTATKCRHPLLRRAAVRLLDRDEVKRRRENLWTGHELVIIASWVIRIEEQRDDAGVYEHDLSSLFGREGYWHDDSELRVPLTQPPRLKKPTVDFNEDQLSDLGHATSLDHPMTDGSESASPQAQELETTATLTNVDPAMLEVPHGVLEQNRIKNVLIGASRKGGVWLTTFEDPKPGEVEWQVRKVFLRT